ncbi:MAG: PEP-CTERM sorting domain-containing protein [Bryobacteraceae bacterium]
MKKTLLAALLATGLASAANVTFTFTSSGGTETNAGNYGNTRTYTDASGLFVTISAYGMTASSNTRLETGYVGQYSGAGLGACNQEENCADPQHQVDNADRYDFLLFAFSAPVDPASITVRPFGDVAGNDTLDGGGVCAGNADCADADLTYFLRTNAAAPNMTGGGGLNLAGIIAAFSAGTDRTTGPGTAAVTYSLSGTGVTYLLIAAKTDETNDFFKVQSVTVNTLSNDEPTPEPATLGLMGAALVGLGLMRRKA